MTVKNKLFTVLSSLLMVFAVGSFAFAQETTTTTQDKNAQETPKDGKKGFGHRGGPDGMRGGHGKGFGHRGGMMRAGFAKLNLSEEQKTQMKNLHESFKTSNEASFKEIHTLFQQKRDKTITAEGEARLQALKTQMKSAHDQLRGSIQNILTAEQKTQLETMKQEFRQKREERRKMREQRAPKPEAPGKTPVTKDNTL
jgi:membrane-bound lytic murein transglycosylase